MSILHWEEPHQNPNKSAFFFLLVSLWNSFVRIPMKKEKKKRTFIRILMRFFPVQYWHDISGQLLTMYLMHSHLRENSSFVIIYSSIGARGLLKYPQEQGTMYIFQDFSRRFFTLRKKCFFVDWVMYTIYIFFFKLQYYAIYDRYMFIKILSSEKNRCKNTGVVFWYIIA